MKKILKFGCKCLFEHRRKPPVVRSGFRLYEEQVILVAAATYEDARKKVSKMARNYASRDMSFKGVVGIHLILDRKIEDGTEVFCAFRESKLSHQDYIKHFFKSPHDFRVAWDED